MDFVAKDAIGRGLLRLQLLLTECLGYRNGGMTTEVALHAKRMRTITEDVVRQGEGWQWANGGRGKG
jgi:hypothetical protein